MRGIAWVVVIAACRSGDPPAAPCDDDEETTESGCAKKNPDCGDAAIPFGPTLACRPIGVPKDGCAPGFAHDGHGGCSAILPAAPCAEGTMAVPSETTCHEVAPCGTGTWGDIPTDASTLYVDAAYVGTDSDGSRDKPWRTILSATSRGKLAPLIAVAAGTYKEQVNLSLRARLFGRCPSMVKIVPPDPGATAVTLTVGTELHAVEVSGGSPSVQVSGKDARIERVHIRDANTAISLFKATGAVLTGLLLERVQDGVVASGGDVTMTRSVVRDCLRPDGGGICLAVDKGEAPGTLVVDGSLVERWGAYGVNVRAGNLDLKGSVLRDHVRPKVFIGAGMAVYANADDPACCRVSVTRSVIERADTAAVYSFDVPVLLDRSVISGTREGPGDVPTLAGNGLVAFTTRAVVRASLLTGNHFGAIHLGAGGALDDTIVRDTQTALGRFGYGLALYGDTEVRTSLVAGNTFAGVYVLGSNSLLEDVVIRDTKALADGRFGDGVVVGSLWTGPKTFEGKATLRRVRIGASARAGIAVFGAAASVERAALACNAFDLDVEQRLLGEGAPTTPVAVSLDDRGMTTCGCPRPVYVCRAASASLEPTPPPPKPG